YYDPIRASRRLPRTSQDGWLYRGALPDDLVWAAPETVPTLSHSPFWTCRYPYAGGKERCTSSFSPSSMAFAQQSRARLPHDPAPGFMAGPSVDASVFASCCGPPSCSPLDQVPPVSRQQRLLLPSFPHPGHPEMESGITTQPTGLLLWRDFRPLGEC